MVALLFTIALFSWLATLWLFFKSKIKEDTIPIKKSDNRFKAGYKITGYKKVPVSEEKLLSYRNQSKIMMYASIIFTVIYIVYRIFVK